jgi:hypothetical protein
VSNLSSTGPNETRALTIREFKEAEFTAVDVARDGKTVRLRFASSDGEIGLCLAHDNLSGMIPVVIRAEAQGFKNAGIPDAVRPFVTSDAGVSVCPDRKHLVITMILPGDRGRIGFQIDPQTARGLLRILAKNLGDAGLVPTPH